VFGGGGVLGYNAEMNFWKTQGDVWLSRASRFADFLPLGVFVFLAYLAVWFSLGSIKIYWTDELFSLWTTGNGNLTLAETLRLAGSGRDGMMPLFYLTGNVWSKLGANLGVQGELWMRVPSLIWTVAGFGFLYWVMKSRHGSGAAAIGLAVGLLCSIAGTQEMTWLRAYGALVGLTAGLVAAAGLPEGRLKLGIFFLGNAGLVLVHPYGILYGGAVTLAPVLVSGWRGEWSRGLGYCLSVVPAVAILLLKREHLSKVSLLGGEGGMWPVPNLEGLIFACVPLSQPVLVLFVLLVGGGVALLSGGGQSGLRGRIGQFELATFFLLLVPFTIWTISQWSSFFVIRYFAPMVVFSGVATSLLFSRLLGGGGGKVLALCLVALLSILYVRNSSVRGEARVAQAAGNALSMGKIDAQVFSDGRGGVHPLIIEDLDLFLPRMFYNPSGRYYFPVREISPDEGFSQIKTLSQNLVLAHGASHLETGGRVGIAPEMILDRTKLDKIIQEFDTLFIWKHPQKGTGGFVEEELSRKGWVGEPYNAQGIFRWRKPRP
jgi:hypothetical protein